MRRIIEAGHYYAAKGPTQWSVRGWEILERVATSDDQTMIFIDDVHALDEMSDFEREEPPRFFTPNAHYCVKESSTEAPARESLEMLKVLPVKRSRARKQNGGEAWYCSGGALTNSQGVPLCVLYDTGLTLLKSRLGFCQGINILPIQYRTEQEHLLRIIKKILPDFSLTIILFDLNGGVWEFNNAA